MTNNNYYEYVDEQSISTELICIICNNPLNDPVCTSCDHTYCRSCIVGWINGGNPSCPACRNDLKSADNLKKTTRTVQNLVDQLPVKCNFCGKTGIQRFQFDEHMSRKCKQIEVSCTSADIKCPWKGTRDQLQTHLATCSYHPFRTIIAELMTKNRQLEEQVQQLSNAIKTRPTNDPSSNRNSSCDNCRNCIFLRNDVHGGRLPAPGRYYHAVVCAGFHYNSAGIGMYVNQEPCDCDCHNI